MAKGKRCFIPRCCSIFDRLRIARTFEVSNFWQIAAAGTLQPAGRRVHTTMIEFRRERELSIKREHDTFSINTSINKSASQRSLSLG